MVSSSRFLSNMETRSSMKLRGGAAEVRAGTEFKGWGGTWLAFLAAPWPTA